MKRTEYVYLIIYFIIILQQYIYFMNYISSTIIIILFITSSTIIKKYIMMYIKKIINHNLKMMNKTDASHLLYIEYINTCSPTPVNLCIYTQMRIKAYR